MGNVSKGLKPFLLRKEVETKQDFPSCCFTRAETVTDSTVSTLKGNYS